MCWYRLGLIFALLEIPVVITEQGSLLYKKEGDFVIGALLALREFNVSARVCGPILDLGAVRRAEAVAFAVDQINNDESILQNVTLGYEIYDTCYDSSVALRRSLDFTERFRDGSDNVIGIVGTSLSATASVTSLLMSNFNMTMISHFATSDDLSNSDRYPFFMRIIAPDSYQVNAIIDILLHYGWEYVAFIYTENIYGRGAYDVFVNKIKQTNICVPYSRGLRGSEPQSVYKDTLDDLQELRSQSHLSVVILFAELENIHQFMQTVYSRNATRQFIWIGSDSFGIPCLNSIKGIEEAALGALTMIPKAGINEKFEHHFQKAQNESESDNPWMQEYRKDVTENDDCPAFDSLLSDAVGVFARGMDALLRMECPNQNISECKQNILKENRIPLQRLLLNVSYNSLSNGKIFFLNRGDSLGRYDIRHLVKTEPGQYRFVTVGNWTADDRLLMEPSVGWDIEDDHVLSSRYSFDKVPKSLCADPCGSGQRRITLEDQPCCWRCEQCDDDRRVVNETCADSCINETAEIYRWPREDRQECVDLEKQVRSSRPESIIIIFLGFVGMVITLIATAMYYTKREERLIKASSRELSYIIAIGVFCTYLGSAFYMTEPSKGTCTIRRILPHVATSLIYVSIGTITVRLYRIFKAGKKSLKRPKFIHPKSQIMITVSLSAVPVIWGIVWLCLQPPTIHIEVNSDESNRFLLVLCSTSIIHRIGQLVWDIAVVFVCCYFAFRARNLPANYNQSRFIAFSVFSTLVVYIAFAPALVMSDSLMQDLYSALGLLIQATVVICLVIIVRLYAVMYTNFIPTETSENSRSANPGSSQTNRDDSGKPISSISKSLEIIDKTM